MVGGYTRDPIKELNFFLSRSFEIRHNPSRDIGLDSLVIWDIFWAELSGPALSAEVGCLVNCPQCGLFHGVHLHI